MTNWNDPVLQVAQGFALIKLFHIAIGVYIWEFVLNLDYEYSLTTRKRKFNRTVPLYLGCRWSTLLAVVTQLLALNRTVAINCQALIIMKIVFGYFGFLSASCLIILRIYALWERKRVIVAVAFTIWLSNSITFVYTIAISRPLTFLNFCTIDHIVDDRIVILSSFITDIVLLSLMLIGVFRWKRANLPVMGGIWGIMYMQGLIAIITVTLADAPVVVFILLNLNNPMDSMFMVPSMIIMSISALRLHRGLVDSAVVNRRCHMVVEADGAIKRLTAVSVNSDIQIAIPIARLWTTRISGKWNGVP